MTVVASFGELSFQHADAFAQSRHVVSQGGMLLSELVQFFIFGHACTLLACSLVYKPLVLLVRYSVSKLFMLFHYAGFVMLL